MATLWCCVVLGATQSTPSELAIITQNMLLISWRKEVFVLERRINVFSYEHEMLSLSHSVGERLAAFTVPKQSLCCACENDFPMIQTLSNHHHYALSLSHSLFL
uniref:Putative secreted protein n=1 Tax=Anopheles marajoara TaxID=58244 RepID=A0A2M4C9F4_9DIPT